LITFRTYGTWLHGDQRGSIDRTHNVYGTPLLLPDARREQYERAMARHEALVLGAAERSAVREAILQVADFRQWTLHELAVRSNHVHMVVSAPCDPDHVIVSLKAWTTRRLRERGLIRRDRRVWSTGGSRKYLWKPHQLRAACRYVLDGQGADL